MVQALHLMNSNTLQSQLTGKSGRAAKLAQAEISPKEIVEEIFLAVYSRWPSDEEKKIGLRAFAAEEAKRQQVVEDLMWALINSAEFVFNH